MKVVKKAEMPDGTKIQIEDWKESYDFMNVLIIGTYPIAKNSDSSGFIQSGQTFRLELCYFKNDDEVKEIFNSLEEGKISLQELKQYYRDRRKDEFYLGIRDNEYTSKIEEEEEL